MPGGALGADELSLNFMSCQWDLSFFWFLACFQSRLLPADDFDFCSVGVNKTIRGVYVAVGSNDILILFYGKITTANR